MIVKVPRLVEGTPVYFPKTDMDKDGKIYLVSTVMQDLEQILLP